jgi:hypothetical protein
MFWGGGCELWVSGGDGGCGGMMGRWVLGCCDDGMGVTEDEMDSVGLWNEAA